MFHPLIKPDNLIVEPVEWLRQVKRKTKIRGKMKIHDQKYTFHVHKLDEN